MSHICPKCDHEFSCRGSLYKHFIKITPCNPSPSDEQKRRFEILAKDLGFDLTRTFVCNDCGEKFNRKDVMSRHVKNGYCLAPLLEPSTPLTLTKESPHNMLIMPKDSSKKKEYFSKTELYNIIGEMTHDMSHKLQSLTETISKLNTRYDNPPHPSHNVNNLSICVGSDDNFDDILISRMGKWEAIEFITNCALTHQKGDSRLLEKVYLIDNLSSEARIQYTSPQKNEVLYYDRHNNKITETTDAFTDKLATFLSDCYSRTYGWVREYCDKYGKYTYNHLDDYEMEKWGAHMRELTLKTYKRKMISHVNIFNITPK